MFLILYLNDKPWMLLLKRIISLRQYPKIRFGIILGEIFCGKLSFDTFYEVLKVSYCDRTLSGVHHALSINIFSSVTSGPIGMKLHRKHPLNVLT